MCVMFILMFCPRRKYTVVNYLEKISFFVDLADEEDFYSLNTNINHIYL